MPCEGFLMAVEADGAPVLISVDALRKLSGESIEPEECCITLNKRTFEAAYSLYIEWHTSSPTGCFLIQLCETPASG